MQQPPEARRDIVQDEYFGTIIEDAYRWMEDWQSEEVQAWTKAQAIYTRDVLASHSERSTLLARISDLGNAGPVLYDFQVANGRYFYLRRDPGESLASLVMHSGLGSAMHTLLNPNEIPDSVHTAIDWYTPSHDGKLVAFGLSQGGSEDSTLSVLAVDSGKKLDLAIEHIIYGGVNWLEDSRSFTYNRSPGPSSEENASRYTNSHVYLHRLGDHSDNDLALFGRGVHPQVPFETADIPYLSMRMNSQWIIGTIAHGDMQELTIYVTNHSLLSSPHDCLWTKVADIEDEVTGLDFANEMLYLLTHRQAPHFKVLALSLEQPDIAIARVAIPESFVIIENIRVAGDYLLIRDLDGGIGRVRQLKHGQEIPRETTLPAASSILEWSGERTNSKILLQLTAWTVSPAVFYYDADNQTLTNTGWQAPTSVDFSIVEAEELKVPTSDGTLVPLSVIHRRGIVRDGSHPTILMGYGSYGISFVPFFWPQMLAWYERGGVLAIAHIRGGGECGNEWHKAGHKLNKENTITDFIACAEFLIAQGYTSSELLVGQGGSAGGIPVGGALVRRPDLWGAIVLNVPLTNTLRFELTENGPPNVFEFGSTSTEDGFRALQIIDSYARIQDQTAYPAVLITSGANDPRVAIWMATKMAARLQAATSSEKPIFLRVEFQAGHGVGSTKQQRDEELADTMAFLLWQLNIL